MPGEYRDYSNYSHYCIQARRSPRETHGCSTLHHKQKRVIVIQSSFTPQALSRREPIQSATLAAKRTPQQRLSLISRHLDQRLPLPELNTPFSTERNSLAPDDIEYKPLDRTASTPTTSPSTPSTPSSPTDSSPPTAKMSSQAPHPTLLIPGPIEFDDAVLQSMAHYA